MSVIVRIADPSEAAVVHRIMLAAFATHLGELDPPSGAHAETLADVEAAMKRGGAVLAVYGSVAVGSARFEITPDAVHVGRVAVLPEHRRRGVASTMMRFFEALAPSLDRHAIRVGVRASLASNVRLYRALGYEVTSIEPHPRGPDRVVMMHKRVAPPASSVIDVTSATRALDEGSGSRRRS